MGEAAMTDRIILSGIVGSTAYGLATPDSDVDRLGVYQIPTREMFYINGPSQLDKSWVQTNPDITMHELFKFVKLCAGCNPTVMELLWLENHEQLNFTGAQLIELRSDLLSRKVGKTYGGYAAQQMKRLKERGDGSFKSKLRKRREKHARHLARLLIQGTQLLETGILNVKLTQAEVDEVREVSVLEDGDLQAWFDMKIGYMDRVDTALPSQPDYDAINSFLFTARLNYLGEKS